jgi:hypothetical protein
MGPCVRRDDEVGRSRTHLRVPAAPCVRVLRHLPPQRAWGMPGAQCTRSLVWVEKPHELVTTGPPGSPGIPARDGLRLISCSPRSSGFLVSVIGGVASTDLTPTAEASGPHDFAVRFRAVRHRHYQRPPHPAPRFVTLRNAPQVGRDGEHVQLIWVGPQALFLKIINLSMDQQLKPATGNDSGESDPASSGKSARRLDRKSPRVRRSRSRSRARRKAAPPVP